MPGLTRAGEAGVGEAEVDEAGVDEAGVDEAGVGEVEVGEAEALMAVTITMTAIVTARKIPRSQAKWLANQRTFLTRGGPES